MKFRKWTVTEWEEAGMDRRQLCLPRHVLFTWAGYTLYAYGDVCGPDGIFLGHADELEDHEHLPVELQELWGGFLKYWCCSEYLDLWEDCGGAVVRLDHQTGRYIIEDEDAPVPGSFATVGEAIWAADPGLWRRFHVSTIDRHGYGGLAPNP